MSTFTIKLVNERGDDRALNLLFTATACRGVSGLTPDSTLDLASFKTSNPEMTIGFDMVNAGRLYVGYGALDSAPLPDGTQYYGWIEFTKKDSDTAVWINLSNVDMVALPLTLSGTSADGTPFTLGYKVSTQALIKTLKDTVLTAPTAPAVIACESGQTKIVAPNGMPGSYPTYDDYLETLMEAEASLIIESDTPPGGRAQVFSGQFKKALTDTDVMISLRGEEQVTFEVLKGQLSSAIIYRCDGGTLIYGGTTYPQNRTSANDPGSTQAQRTITNSIFRNILIGLNEGYFTPSGDNRSANFPYFSPFQAGHGNAYAKLLHESSNSYGFPYADANLKVLITADPAQALTLTIIGDHVAAGYDAAPPDGANAPDSGAYQFGIGAGSAALGVITIGNCRYPPNPEGAYGGYLPTLDAWIKMEFQDIGKHIWIKTSGDGADTAAGCFNSDPVWIDKSLTWGAQVSWLSGVPSPPQPKG